MGSPLTVQQTNSDTSVLVDHDFSPLLVSGISQPLTLSTTTIVNSVTVQFSNSFVNDGFAYLDIVQDDGTGKPSNAPTAIFRPALKPHGIFTVSATRFTSSLPLQASPVHIVLRTQNVISIGYGALNVVTGSRHR